MTWTQNFNPLNNLALSALVAIIPIVFFFWALAIRRMKGYLAGFLTTVCAIILAIAVYGMPAKLAILSTLSGSAYGLFPIGWIVITAVFLYNVSVKSGQFEIVKNSIANITEDRRMQALLIAFAFGAFLEGAAGFGTPVAITAAMLVGLGFEPLYAAGLCLIANTAPVAFGGIGIPIIVAGQVSGIDAMAISQMVGRQLPILSVIVPFVLIMIMSGWKGTKEVIPAILVTGVSFAGAQWFSANYLSPMLPDIISSLASIVSLVLFLKVWKPKNIWRFPHENKNQVSEKHAYSFTQVLKAWAPFIILTAFISAWGMNPVKALFDSFAIYKFHIPGLDQMIIKNGTPMEAIFKFNYLSAAGTAILISSIVSLSLYGMLGKGFGIFVDTLKSLKFPLITMGCVLGFAYLTNFSGMSTTMGMALAKTGKFFPFISPILGWLGVFITGSDTSANALFGKLQAVTAQNIGVDPVLTLAANSSGGVTAKMISPQSIAVATASVGLIGKESDLFRFALKYSLIFALAVSVITAAQAFIFKFMIPKYKIVEAVAAAAAPAPVDVTTGLTYLGIAVAVVLFVYVTVAVSTVMGKKANA